MYRAIRYRSFVQFQRDFQMSVTSRSKLASHSRSYCWVLTKEQYAHEKSACHKNSHCSLNDQRSINEHQTLQEETCLTIYVLYGGPVS
jgi:hypothetical protein